MPTEMHTFPGGTSAGSYRTRPSAKPAKKRRLTCPLRNACHICAVDSGFAVDRGYGDAPNQPQSTDPPRKYVPISRKRDKKPAATASLDRGRWHRGWRGALINDQREEQERDDVDTCAIRADS